MSKKTKVVLGLRGRRRRRRRPDGLHSRPGQGPSEGDDRQGREGGRRRQGHRQRQDPGGEQGRPLGPGHGPDRQPGRARGRPRQEGQLPPPDRPGAAAAAGAGPRGEPGGHASDLDSAQGQRRAGQARLRARQKNYEARILPEADYQKAQSSLDAAKAHLAATEQRIEQSRAILNATHDTLSKTTVRSPIDGIVTTLPVKAGEVTVIGTMNNAGTQLMTISDMSTVQAVLMVDETPSRNVKVGQKAMLRVDAYPDRTFDGVVTEVGHSPIQKDDPDLQGLITTTEAINFKVKIKIASRPTRSGRASRSRPTSSPARSRRRATIPLAAVVVRDSGERDDDRRRASRPRRASTSSRTARLASCRSRPGSRAS